MVAKRALARKPAGGYDAIVHGWTPPVAACAAVFALAACSFDARPITPVAPDAATPAAVGGGSGGSQTPPDAALPPDAPDAGATDMPVGAFGLRCGGETCPVAPQGTTQCCTRADDVDARTARTADRCGLDLSEGGGAAGCHQLEQPGIADPTCPAATPPGALVEEQGCCSDQGWCGTLDVARGTGCHANDGPEKRCDEDVDADVMCEATGHFAIRAAIDVVWGGRGLGGLVDITDDGRGDIEIRLLATVEKLTATEDFLAEVRACSVVLPPFRSSVLCEAYQPVFPDTIWDSGKAPRFQTQGHYQCLNPGCIVTFDALTSLVGIAFDDPGAMWPKPTESAMITCAAGMGVECYSDHDGDGRPGITIEVATDGMLPAKPGAMQCATGYTRRAAPLNANPLSILGGVRRADRILLGTRVRLGGAGRVQDDCNGGDGGGIAEFVESRAAGCYVQEGTADPFGFPAGPDTKCNDTEAAFIDQNLPVYTILRAGDAPDMSLMLDDTAPSPGPRFGLRRLGSLKDDVDCADVRAAAF